MPRWDKNKKRGWTPKRKQGAGHMSNARNPKGFGSGTETADDLWDKYQSRETVGAMGAGQDDQAMADAQAE